MSRALRQRAKLWIKARLSAGTDRLLGDHVTGLLVQAGDHRLLVEPGDYGVGLALRRNGRYGEDEVRRLAKLVGPTDDVLVVGAHVGTLAIPLASLARSVTAVEANPKSFELLTDNIELNHVHNIEAVRVAASDREQVLPFLANRANSGGSKIAPRLTDYRYSYDRPKQIAVIGRPLDEVFHDRTFGVIVMDIEGSEYPALCGMPELLAQAEHLVVEFVPHHLRNVSAVSVAEFLEPLFSFDTVFAPSLGRTGRDAGVAEILTHLYENDLSDDGLVFSRSRLPR